MILRFVAVPVLQLQRCTGSEGKGGAMAVLPAAFMAAAACLIVAAVVPGCGGQLPLSQSPPSSSSFVHFPISNPNGEFNASYGRFYIRKTRISVPCLQILALLLNICGQGCSGE